MSDNHLENCRKRKIWQAERENNFWHFPHFCWQCKILISPCNLHVSCCMRWPKKILNKESHLNEDRQKTPKSDEDAPVCLVPGAYFHFNSFWSEIILKIYLAWCKQEILSGSDLTVSYFWPVMFPSSHNLQKGRIVRSYDRRWWNWIRVLFARGRLVDSEDFQQLSQPE